MRRLFWIVLLPLLGPACSGGVELSGDGAVEGDGSPADAVDGTDARDGPGELPGETADVAIDDGAADETDGEVSCAAQDARAEGDCGMPLGVKWDGAHCVPLGSGCTCVGADCGGLYHGVGDCFAARRACYGDVCRAQEAAGRMCDGGGCVTHLGAFWDGHECFEVIGCECVGADCDAGMMSLDECIVVHATCDGALCVTTGGSWFPASAGFCGFECGLPSEMDCFAPMDSCDCGPGRTFLSGAGCPDEPEACDAGFLCRATGGVWHGAPGCYCPYRCGEELPECYACGEVCDCGPSRNFDSQLGCVPDALCPGAGRETACTSTGGTWHECGAGDPWCSCGDYVCGRPNTADPCTVPGCDCGSLRNFDTHRGCVYDATCTLHVEGQSCLGGAAASTCRTGLVCCPNGGPYDSGSTCRAPCCPDSPICMDDGCPVPPP